MTILQNQSILDAVLTRYGSMEAAIAFCLSNGTSISYLPNAGASYTEPAVKGNAAVQRYLRSRDITIGTAGNTVCGRVYALELIAITATTITVSFTAGEGAIALEWGIGDEEPETLHTSSIGATVLEIEGLAPGTASKFWIRSVCEGAVSIWNIMPFVTAEVGFHHDIILRPVRMHVTKDADSTYGYVLNYTGDPDFVNTYPLLEDWQAPTHLLRHTKEQIDMYGALHPLEVIGLTPASGNMTAKSAQFVSHSLALPGSTYLWNTAEGGLPDNIFPRFIDTEGNRAACSPVLVYDTVGDSLYTMLGTMTLGSGYTDHGMYMLPITISHEGDNAFFNIISMKLIRWTGTDYAFVATASPGTTVIAELMPGTHELLLCVIYRSVDAIDNTPVSFNAIVIDVSL